MTEQNNKGSVTNANDYHLSPTPLDPTPLDPFKLNKIKGNRSVNQ